jgi:LPXTG-motif cell wall-anchored protein
VAILAGAVVLDERITVWAIVGFALVLAGSWLVTRRRQQPVAPSDPGGAPAQQE